MNNGKVTNNSIFFEGSFNLTHAPVSPVATGRNKNTCLFPAPGFCPINFIIVANAKPGLGRKVYTNHIIPLPLIAAFL
ncbi:MAG TPA: hypothetical protein VG847_03555 [Chitinophagaceae bacterium]|nr:hypothetical protein [Chitinophagaceae bacterium]